MFKKSLKAKILLLTNAGILLIIVLLSAAFFTSQKSQLLQQSYQSLNSMATQVGLNISNWAQVRHDIIEGVSANVDKPDLSAYLLQARTAGRFALAFYGDETGRMVDADPTINRKGYDPRKRDWYTDTKQAGHPTLSKPYISASLKKLIVAFSRPTPNGVVSGVVDIDNIINDINKLNIAADGEAVLVTADGTVIAYKDKDKILKPSTDIAEGLTANFLQTALDRDELVPVTVHDASKLALASNIPNTDWRILIFVDESTLLAPVNHQLIQQILTGLGIGILLSIILSMLIGVLFRPLKTVSVALESIAKGNGDLTQRIPLHTSDEIGVLANNFNSFVDSLHGLISHIRTLAVSIDTDAESGLNRSQTSETELARQQQELTMVATAVTEMASATQEIAGNAEQTAAAALQSSESSEAGKSTVNKTRESINQLASGIQDATDVITQLEQHAQEISGILSTIQGIAAQTNLLALNAAIEAARAGEQGRGFAVVADEVRVLSQRTTASTAEIQTTIETLQQTTKKAVDLMAKSRNMATNSVDDAAVASAALEEITRAVSTISDMANQIATAAEEQSHVTSEITQNITAIKDVADQLADDAIQGKQDAMSLQTHAADLSNKVTHFIL